MSGMSSRFSRSGYHLPKYLLNVDGKTVIQHIVELYPKDSEFIFIMNDKNATETNILDVIERFNLPNSQTKVIPSHKLGPVYTVSHVFDWIDDEEQVVVNYCDFSIYWNYQKFEEFINDTQCDGCVVCYTGFHPHMLGNDNYAFCKTDKSNKILEVREKQPFTNNKMNEFASAGNYYFRKGKYIKQYFRQMMDVDSNLNGEYYVSLIYNFLIKDGLSSLVYEVPKMLQWGTPLDLDMYLKWSEYYKKSLIGQKTSTLYNCVTALPMAGAGSRFAKEGYTESKPFIQVNGKNMFEQAVRCLPKTDRTIYACLGDQKAPHSVGGEVLWIDEVLEGQACTTERILDYIPSDKSILISACDNGMFYDSDKFLKLVEDEDNDVIVWTYTNNYTSYRNPEMYSWVLSDDKNNIEKINVKKFFGGNPIEQFAVVGTFFFRNKEVYLNSLQKMYEDMGRVNNEYYIDSLVNYSIDLGYKVKNFEIDEYICWGTPNDLKTYQYWQNFFNQVNWHDYSYDKDYFTN